MTRMAFASLLVFLVQATVGLAPAQAQVSESIREMKLRDWQPQSMLATEGDRRSRRPSSRSSTFTTTWAAARRVLTPERVAHYLAEMDATGVQTVVNLDGGWDERLEETLDALDQAHPGRFLTFALINFEGIDEPGWTDRELKRLEAGFKAGAKGLKIHKTLGLGHRYKDGRLVAGRRSQDRPALGAVRPVQSPGR